MYVTGQSLKDLRIRYPAPHDLISHTGGKLCSVLYRSEVLDAARNSVRIKVCYIMIALTLLGCLAMVITGKEVSIVSG